MINEKYQDFGKIPVSSGYFKYKLENQSLPPVVSIITPFYNTGKIFTETVNSILHQSFQSFEWIIVNDNSSDEESLSLLDSLSKSDPRIKVFNNSINYGPSGARNQGIKAASTEYLFFIDADDLIEHTTIEKYFLLLNTQNEYDFVNSWGLGFGEQQYFWRGDFSSPQLFLEENRVTTCFMAQKSLFTTTRFEEEIKHGFEDWDFWLQVLSEGKSGFTIKEYLFWYRRTDFTKKWENWDNGEKQNNFKKQIKHKYGERLKTRHNINQDLDAGYNITKTDVINIEPVNVLHKENKRILCIFPWLNLGGSDKFNLDAIEGLVKKGWEVTITTTLKSNNEWMPLFSNWTSDIFPLPDLAAVKNYYKILFYLVQSRKPDVILISNSLYGYWAIPFLKNVFPNIPIVDYIHCEDFNWMNGGYPRVNTMFSTLLDKTIVSSNQLKQFIYSLSDGRERECVIDVCYTNIDHHKVKKDIATRDMLRQQYSIPDHFDVIIYPVRFVEQKQPFVMAETMKKLKAKTNNFICLAIGDGPLFNDFKAYIKENDIEDKVWCLGAQTNEEVLKYMDASDIFFLPSLYEGIALSMYEALAKELVVVGAVVGGQAELVTDKVGYLIHPSNPVTEADQYCNIIFNLIINKEHKALLQKRSRETITRSFGISEMYDRLDTSLSNVIKSRENHYNSDINPESYIQLLNHFLNTESISNLLWNEITYLKSGLTDKIGVVTGSNIEDINWIRSQHDIIKEWYRQEYEVLPLWYKRFGHILKVLKGKRKISSLLK
jgi:glycosyltransferase involved in cell wall biosynthesis